MSNVTSLKNEVTQVKGITSYMFMQVVRDALYEYGDMEMLANKTGLSNSALYNIRSGRTKWPRWTTLQVISLSLGLEFAVHRVNPINRQVNTTALRSIT